MKIPGEGSELHRQIYSAWRHYPLAVKHTAWLAFNIGLMIGVGLHLLLS